MKCHCYLLYENCYGKDVGVCMGTKEMEKCDCGGDKAKCDFYADKRKKPRESKPKTLSELVKLLLDNNFKLTIQRGYSCENSVLVTIDDTVHDRHAVAKIRGTDRSYSVPDEILIDYIVSMTDELKNYSTLKGDSNEN